MENNEEAQRRYDGDPTFEELASQMYFDGDENKSDTFFSLSVFQITVCIVMTLIIFLMSFFGPLKNSIGEAIDYFQGFELTGDDIRDEVTAMKAFLTDAEA